MLLLETSRPASSSSSSASNYIDVTDAAYGASTSGTAAGNAAAFAAADAAAVAVGKNLYFPKGTYATTSVTFTAYCVFDWGAILSCTVTDGVVGFTGGLFAHITQLFSFTGNARAEFKEHEVYSSYTKTIVGYAEWWGAITQDTTVDCAPAITAAWVCLKRVQLMPANYFTSTVITSPPNTGAAIPGDTEATRRNQFNELRGAEYRGLEGDGNINCFGVSAIVCQSNSSTIINMTTSLCAMSDIYCTRSVAPLISSLCIGIQVGRIGGDINRCTSTESMIGWKINAASLMHLNFCRAHRYHAGSGAGTDSFIGFWCDGTATAYGTSGGNASLYLNWPFVNCSAGINGSIAYYCDKGYADVFMTHPESGLCSYGMQVVGDGLSYASHTGGDFIVTDPVFDACGKSPLFVSDTNLMGSLVFHGGWMSQSGITNEPMVYALRSHAALSVIGTQFQVYNNTSDTGVCIKASSSSNVSIEGGHILEASGAFVEFLNSSNCKCTARVTNNFRTGNGVKLTNSHRNYLNMMMSGATVGAGYIITDALSSYNEFNCSGLDPTGITGGSANKLVINSTQVTATGIAAAGAGNNYASGIMA